MRPTTKEYINILLKKRMSHLQGQKNKLKHVHSFELKAIIEEQISILDIRKEIKGL